MGWARQGEARQDKEATQKDRCCTRRLLEVEQKVERFVVL